MKAGGYDVHWEALRRESAVVDDRRIQAAEARQVLREAFAGDRATLGADQYGAELARQLPAIESGISDAFDAYLGELDDTSRKLNVAAANYEGVEQVGRLSNEVVRDHLAPRR